MEWHDGKHRCRWANPKNELYIRPFMPKFNKNGSLSLSDIGAFIYYVISELKQEDSGRVIRLSSSNINS